MFLFISKENSFFSFLNPISLPLFVDLFYKCWFIAYSNAQQRNYTAVWNRFPLIKLRDNHQESRMVSYFDKSYYGNKWYAVMGYDSWADYFRECCWKNVFREGNIWNRTWSMKIIQAGTTMQLCAESHSNLGEFRGISESSSVRERAWEEFASKTGPKHVLSEGKENSLYPLSSFLLVFSISVFLPDISVHPIIMLMSFIPINTLNSLILPTLQTTNLALPFLPRLKFSKEVDSCYFLSIFCFICGIWAHYPFQPTERAFLKLPPPHLLNPVRFPNWSFLLRFFSLWNSLCGVCVTSQF